MSDNGQNDRSRSRPRPRTGPPRIQDRGRLFLWARCAARRRKAIFTRLLDFFAWGLKLAFLSARGSQCACPADRVRRRGPGTACRHRAPHLHAAERRISTSCPGGPDSPVACSTEIDVDLWRSPAISTAARTVARFQPSWKRRGAVCRTASAIPGDGRHAEDLGQARPAINRSIVIERGAAALA